MTSRVAATVDEVLQAFQLAPSKSEKGTKFEQLMVRYFQLDPTLSKQYDQVSRWIDWEHRDHTVDTGIDLVARNREDGTWTAIQCKFFHPGHYLAKADIDSFFTASGKTWNGVGFTNRIIISTTDKWSKHAEDALDGQTIPVQRIGLPEIAQSPMDWAFAMPGTLDVELEPAKKYQTRPHQDEAIEKILAGFEEHDRGQWISACGTGKTFTSLKLAEQMADANGGSLRVLFLAPSIQLVAQTLREWTAQTTTDMRPFVVCSDTKASQVTEDIAVHDVVLPATTDPKVLHERLTQGRRARGLTVVFSTYQSIDVVAHAQQLGADDFHLILSDEAHRTTGVTLAGEDESAFVKVHDGSYLRGQKRLYMTATPRIFAEATKGAAAEHSAELSSMDDMTVFGPEFHRLGFGEAVERDLLTDYKVMVLMVSEDQMAAPLQEMVANEDLELPLDDAAKIIGCWNGLAKRTKDSSEAHGFPKNAVPMKRAVAFLQNIKSSKRVAEAFPEMVERAEGIQSRDTLMCEADHVDGTMNAIVRGEKLAWLKAPVPDGECRILTNARCLSEGVDVPALDAVLFMSPRSSHVDVVQSVGRVMRKAEGKDFGYIILPVAVPIGVAPDEALNDNKRFKVVWEVLNALRSHDDRFDAMVNAIHLNKGKDKTDKIILDYVTPGEGLDQVTDLAKAVQPALFTVGQWRDALYARIVDKVGDRTYWDQWAKDIAQISQKQIARINATLDATEDKQILDTFELFLEGLRGNINDSITRDDAVSMLSQHLITAPVFDALFSNSSFALQNPVSLSMGEMLDQLDGAGLDVETEPLDKFYAAVRTKAAAVSSAEGRQTVIHDLYEKFFKNAFPKQSEALGIVYTPVEVVDFILRAADELLRRHFGQGLTDEGVDILDPFTGTGTFIVRLLQSGIIKPEDLARKYTSELMANEIMLLAYYIACVNIEATYEAVSGSTDYVPFPGAIMTDTFQISEKGDRVDTSLIPANNERITKQLDTDITVIVGNPPYSVGQNNENDDNQNLKYPTLDGRIAETYAERSSATLKNSLYDSYVRAYRWATDLLGERGVVAFVSNGGWLESRAGDGMRLSMAEEFAELWVFNLRGNQRTAGELSRKEGGKIFGSGSRNTVAIVLGVKIPDHPGPSRIRYRDIGDYLSREQKLHILETAHLSDDGWNRIVSNGHGDWLDQRDDAFLTYPALGRKEPTALFTHHGSGLKTNRDAWCYGFEPKAVVENMARMVSAYNDNLRGERIDDPKVISWSGDLIQLRDRGVRLDLGAGELRPALYRPFTQMYVFYDRLLNNRVGIVPAAFPTKLTANVGFLVVDPNPRTPFSLLATDLVPDSKTFVDATQYFARWTYEPSPKRAESEALFDDGDDQIDGYRRIDNITDYALAAYREALGSRVSKDDIFNYIYGVLHSPQYRTRFAADLKKMMPRIPLTDELDDFQAFVDAGQALMDLHIKYETVEPHPLEEQVKAAVDMDDWELYAVGTSRMKFPKRKGETDKSTLIYNPHLTITGIPDEAHRYQLGSRSALEWIIDRYYIKTDKASGIVNDPNAWSREVGDPRYIIDLIGRVVTVSVETMKIVDSLPELGLGD